MFEAGGASSLARDGDVALQSKSTGVSPSQDRKADLGARSGMEGGRRWVQVGSEGGKSLLMRKIGLLGGMSSEATALYYERINAIVRTRLGGLSSGDMLIISPDFEPLIELRRSGAFDLVGSILADNAEWLVRAGAEVIVICADPMFGVAAAVAARIAQLNADLGAGARLIDAAAETMQALKAYGFDRPLLLSMQNGPELEAYGEQMRRGGVQIVVPSPQDRQVIERVLLDEICAGRVHKASRDRLLDVIESGIAQGADCVILACPELGILLDPSDLLCPGFDSAALHAEAAVDLALDLCEVPTPEARLVRSGGGAP